MNSVLARAKELQSWIGQGRILEAMNEFYAPDVSMQENTKPPTVGLAANIEREKQFLGMVKAWKGYDVRSLAADEKTGVTLVETTAEYITQQDQAVRSAQVAVQRWKDGKIIDERFYYDTAK